jgi:hypothetical protein
VIGLARMALQLAADRKWAGVRLAPEATPVTRDKVEAAGPGVLKLSEEYYRIIDRVARGEKP